MVSGVGDNNVGQIGLLGRPTGSHMEQDDGQETCNCFFHEPNGSIFPQGRFQMQIVAERKGKCNSYPPEMERGRMVGAVQA